MGTIYVLVLVIARVFLLIWGYTSALRIQNTKRDVSQFILRRV